MKISELKQIVVDLNDGEEPDYETTLVSALNLALNHLNRIIPFTKTIAIEQDKPVLAIKGDVNTATAYTGWGVNGISFEARGEGSVLINGVVIKSWDRCTSYTPIRIIPPSDNVILTFSGIAGAIANLGFFANVLSEELIPIVGDMISYDMSRLTEDFISFHVPPSRDGGDYLPGFIYRPPLLLVPASETGRIHISYKRKPARISLQSVVNDEDIDVDRECEDLLGLLCGYYVNLESNRDKALVILNTFNAQAALAITGRRSVQNNQVYTRYGW